MEDYRSPGQKEGLLELLAPDMNDDEQDRAKMSAPFAPDFDGARYIRAAGTALICVVVIYAAWALLPVAHAIFSLGKSYR